MNKKKEKIEKLPPQMEEMSPQEALMFLMQRFNVIQNDLSASAALNGNAFFQAATKHYEFPSFKDQLAVDYDQPSTSSGTYTSSSSSSTKKFVDPLQKTVENLKKHGEKYEKILNHCNRIVETLTLSTPPPPKACPPPTPEIAEMLKICQKDSFKALTTFNSKMTIKEEKSNMLKLFNPFAPEEKLQFSGNQFPLEEFVNDWVLEKLVPIDCKIYSSNNIGEMQIFECHQILLENFSIKLKSDFKTKAFQMDNKNILHIPFFEFPANIVESFLIACYGGPLNNCQGVYLMAKQLRTVSVMNASIQNLESNLTIQNVVSQYKFAYENDEFNLMKKCVEFIKSQFEYVKLYNEFQNLPENILHELSVNIAMSPNLEIF